MPCLIRSSFMPFEYCSPCLIHIINLFTPIFVVTLLLMSFCVTCIRVVDAQPMLGEPPSSLTELHALKPQVNTTPGVGLSLFCFSPLYTPSSTSLPCRRIHFNYTLKTIAPKHLMNMHYNIIFSGHCLTSCELQVVC